MECKGKGGGGGGGWLWRAVPCVMMMFEQTKEADMNRDTTLPLTQTDSLSTWPHTSRPRWVWTDSYRNWRRNSQKRTLSGTCSSAPMRIHICHSFPQPIGIRQAAQWASHLNSQWQVTCWAQTLRLAQNEETSTHYDINSDSKFLCYSFEL